MISWMATLPGCILSRAASLLPWNHGTKTGGAVQAPLTVKGAPQEICPQQSHCQGKNLELDRFERVHLQVFVFRYNRFLVEKRCPAYLSVYIVYVPPNHAPCISKPWWLMMAIYLWPIRGIKYQTSPKKCRKKTKVNKTPPIEIS